MVVEFIYRMETYKTGSGWEYQIQQSIGQATKLPFGIHDSQGDEKGGYLSENDALMAAKPRLKKMTDSIIKDLTGKNSMARRFSK